MALQVGQALNRLHPFYVDGSGQRVGCAYFSEPQGFGLERWQALAQAALVDLAKRLPKPVAGRQPGAQHLYLVLPEATRAGVLKDLAPDLIKACSELPQFRWTSVRVVVGGHAAGVQALGEAIERLQTTMGSDPSASFVVLAVDSWLHPEALAWLQGEGLLHGSRRMYEKGTHTNAYGRVPSEGAAALCLSRSPGLCQVLGLGLAQEPVSRGEARPTLGAGWTQAAMQALAQAEKLGPSGSSSGAAPEALSQVNQVWSDLNGEPYRADQFGFTGLRLSKYLRDDWISVTPATVAGDLGAASAVAHLALAAHALQGSNETHLLLSASDDALRAAVVLRGWRQERSI